MPPCTGPAPDAPPIVARRPAFRGGVVGAALAFIALGGCQLEVDAQRQRDSAAAAEYTRNASATATSEAGTGNHAVDLPASGPVPFDGVPTPALPVDAADSASVVASPAELLALRGSLVMPVAGVRPSSLTDMYAEARGSRIHEALDILAPRGTPVLSAGPGRVLRLHESRAGGLMVYAADSSDRFILLYGHLDAYAPGLVAGMPLRAGQQIGFVGTTGNAAPGTPHLHFAVLRGHPSLAWWRGNAVNPYPLLVP